MLIAILVILLGSSMTSFIIGQRSQKIVNRICQVCLLLVVLLSVLSAAFVTQAAHWSYSVSYYSGIKLTIDLQYDWLTWVMLCLVSFISLIIHSYASRYLLSDSNQTRFMGQLSFLTFSVMLLVMSGSLLTAFVAWQFIGLSLYLLLNHYHYDVRANRAAKKKFMINRVGDICFLLAVLLAFHYYGTTQFTALYKISSHLRPIILILIFIAVMTKSAQFPFHIWLIDTMETPTPVSALMHAGVINAGGFLLARLSPWYNHAPGLLLVVFFVGITTALLGQFFMSMQVDIKKQLAYSTMGQMGYMIMQCGLGCFASAVFHLIAHGFFKSTLFLSSGSTLLQSNQRTTAATYRTSSSFIATLVTLALIALGYFWLSYLDKTTSMNPLLWLFIGISLFYLLKKVFEQGGSTKHISIATAVIILIYFIYLTVFDRFVLLIDSVVIEKNYFLLTTVVGGCLLALLAMALLLKFLPTKVRKDYLTKFYLVGFYKGGIEAWYRKYLINPMRQWGDLLLQIYYKMPLVLQGIILIFFLLLFGFSLFKAFVGLQSPMLTASASLMIINVVLLVIIGIIANRIAQLKSLLVALIIVSLLLSNTAFSSGNKQLITIGFYHLVNMLLVLIAFGLLLSKRSKRNKLPVKALKKNRLPWCHFYMSILLLLFIGIPGTSSFITEFYLLGDLLSFYFIYSLVFVVFLMLLSLVVLHTLQIHFFNPKAISKHAVAVSPTLHTFCLLVIGFNIYNGIYPIHVLNVISYLL